MEVPISTRYFADASSMGFSAGVAYGLGTLWTALRFRRQRWGVLPSEKFRPWQPPSTRVTIRTL